jgi:hypothetical protein
MKKIMIRAGWAFVIMAGLYSCGGKTKSYKELVEQERKSGRQVDSLFLGFYFGMTSKEFYAYCWELNKKGVFRDGNNNTMVLYKMDTGLNYPAEMNFYPDFYENKIAKMRVEYAYDGWAPWNKKLYADSLMPQVLKLYERWYPDGNKFIRITNPDKGTIYVKVDGNRRITIGAFNDRIVKVDFSDLNIEDKLRK